MNILRTMKTIGAWALALFCFLCGAVYFPQLAACILVLLGVLCLPIPPIRALWKKLSAVKEWMKTAGFVLVLFGCMISLGQQTDTKQLTEPPASSLSSAVQDAGLASSSDAQSSSQAPSSGTSSSVSAASEPSSSPSEPSSSTTLSSSDAPATASSTASSAAASRTTGAPSSSEGAASSATSSATSSAASSADIVPESSSESSSSSTISSSSSTVTKEEVVQAASFTPDALPTYQGKSFAVINDNVPYFTDSDFTSTAFESYSSLDALGRCGVAFACVGLETMPTAERGSIGSVKPSGWHLVKYNGIDGNYLYNRCHLLGYQLTGENANEKNLITGTRYMNVEGMLPWENRVADYVERTGSHVLLRVTPIFQGRNLLADGVLMEAASVEDKGKDLQFNVFCFNVQPNITIDYATGASTGPAFTGSDNTQSSSQGTPPAASSTPKPQPSSQTIPAGGVGENKNISSGTTYVCNTNTHKFHNPGCSSVKDMSNKNVMEVTWSREEVIANGFKPCGRCKP